MLQRKPQQRKQKRLKDKCLFHVGVTCMDQQDGGRSPTPGGGLAHSQQDGGVSLTPSRMGGGLPSSHWGGGWGGSSLTSPYWDVSALCLHHDGGHRQGDSDSIEVGGVRSQGEDGGLRWRGLLPLRDHPVEAAGKPHGAHDGLEQEVHNPAK